MTKPADIREARIRPAAVAGKFYPADPVELRKLIRALLEQVPPTNSPAPKAIIAPHAGYAYSGPVAAWAYARLVPARDRIKRVALFGPAHFVPVAGLATTSATAFSTPLGEVPVDVETVRDLLQLPKVVTLDEAHAREHSLEAHLPFLQTVLEGFSLVPLAVGDTGTEGVREVMEFLWNGPQTLIVVSSDLSHYHDSDTARQCDRATADAIVALDPSRISKDQACGEISIRALLSLARRHGLRAQAVNLRNSGDTAGPRNRVVGYGAFVFEDDRARVV